MPEMRARTHRPGPVPIGAVGRPPGALTNTCPKCQAKPGHSCRRLINPGEGAYWTSTKKPHPERRTPRKPRE